MVVASCLFFGITPDHYTEGQDKDKYGAIVGVVFDFAKVPIPRAQLIAENLKTRVVSETMSDATGHFAFLRLSVGEYKVEVKKSGFFSLLQQPVGVRAEKQTSIHLKMAVAPADSFLHAPGYSLEVFAPVLARVKATSRIPVLLPNELPSAIATAKHAVVDTAGVDEYAITLYYELGTGDAGFAASFSAQGKPKFNPQEVTNVEPVNLAHDLHGFFRAVSCGGSCAPANLWWEENGVLYVIQLELSPDMSDRDQENTIVAVVNSAIMGGPR
jgi:hypothetical protein